QRNRTNASVQGLRMLDVLSTVNKDLRGVVEAANKARANRRDLADLRAGDMANDSADASATGKIDYNDPYVSDRSKVLAEMRERHNTLIAQSGLDEDGRVQVWQGLLGLYEQLALQERYDRTKAGQYEAVKHFVEWVHDNRSKFTVN